MGWARQSATTTFAPMHSLFTSTEPNVFDPTPLTGGPWRPDAQHGGPPSGLLARMIETLVEPDERVARISIELVRPVPLATLTASAERTSVSRRVAHATAELVVDGTVVATARALLLATADLPDPGWRPEEQFRHPEDGTLTTPPTWVSGDAIAFHRDGLEHRVVEGDFAVPGSAIEWVRLRQPLVAGEDASPLCRVTAGADIASGISNVYASTAGVGLINADLTIALHRPLIGEWLGIDAVTRVGPDGIGLCTNRLFDSEGTIGSSTQSLIGLTT